MVLVLIEQTDAKVTDPSLQTLTLARSFGQEVHALLVGVVADLTQHGVTVTHVAEHVGLGSYAPDAWAATMHQLAVRLNASAVLAPGTERRNEAMSLLAARTGVPMAENFVAISPGPPVTLTRQRWGGSLLEEARLNSERPLITVAPPTVGVVPEPLPAALRTL